MFSRLGSILMLHRVAPYKDNGILYNQNMKISPEELEQIIIQMKKEGYEFLSLNDLVSMFKKERKHERKFAVFTLDDGYKDNVQYGYPIFKKYKVPFCIYITNSFPNNTTNLWWYALEELVLYNDTLSFPGSRKIENYTRKQKQENFLKVRANILNTHFRDPLGYLVQLGELNFDLSIQRHQKCLTWAEIKTLTEDPLVSIGCHTLNHYPLSKLDAAEVRIEIEASKKEIESQLGIEVRHFAFPFGSKSEAGKREYSIASLVGFDSITTTIHGHVYRRDNLQRLERIFLYPLHNNSTSLNRVMYWNIKSLLSSVKRCWS